MKSGSPVRGYWTNNRRMTLLGSSSIAGSRYRHKEERKKVLKLSINKLDGIRDPDCKLRKSVLINNTIRRLQREVREDKAARQASWKRSSPRASPQWNHTNGNNHSEEMDTNQDSRSRKRTRHDSSDDLADVQNFLNDIYLPPTPRMITSIDEEEENRQSKRLKEDNTTAQSCSSNDCSSDSEDVSVRHSNSEDVPMRNHSEVKRRDDAENTDRRSRASENEVPKKSDSESARRSDSETRQSEDRRGEILKEINVSDNNTECRTQSESNKPWFYILDSERTYSCAQSSMFGELQRVVYHSLIASMES